MAVFPANFLVASGTRSRSSPPVPGSVGVHVSAEGQIMTQIISHDPGVRSLFTSSVGDPSTEPVSVIADIERLKDLRGEADKMSKYLRSAIAKNISETDLGAFFLLMTSLPANAFVFVSSDLLYRRIVSGKSTIVWETN